MNGMEYRGPAGDVLAVRLQGALEEVPDVQGQDIQVPVQRCKGGGGKVGADARDATVEYR